MKTGQRIQEIRKAQGITQNQLAEKLHVSPSFKVVLKMVLLLSQ